MIHRFTTHDTHDKHIPLSVFGVSSHLFFLLPGVPCPGVVPPGVMCPGVDSQSRVLAPGVAPGVSLPLALFGVSSQSCTMEGVACNEISLMSNYNVEGVHLYRMRVCVWCVYV